MKVRVTVILTKYDINNNAVPKCKSIRKMYNNKIERKRYRYMLYIVIRFTPSVEYVHDNVMSL